MKPKNVNVDPRKYSRLVVDGAKQTPSRSMLRAVGFTDADFKKPQIGIASTWSNLTPCNMHIDKLALQAEAGANAGGGKGVIVGQLCADVVQRWNGRILVLTHVKELVDQNATQASRFLSPRRRETRRHPLTRRRTGRKPKPQWLKNKRLATSHSLEIPAG